MALPPGWEKATTDEGQVYYHNTSTGVTQWEPPASVGAAKGTAMDQESRRGYGGEKHTMANPMQHGECQCNAGQLCTEMVAALKSAWCDLPAIFRDFYCCPCNCGAQNRFDLAVAAYVSCARRLRLPVAPLRRPGGRAPPMRVCGCLIARPPGHLAARLVTRTHSPSLFLLLLIIHTAHLPTRLSYLHIPPTNQYQPTHRTATRHTHTPSSPPPASAPRPPPNPHTPSGVGPRCGVCMW